MPRRGKGEKGDLWMKFKVEMPGESWAARADGEVRSASVLWLEEDADLRCRARGWSCLRHYLRWARYQTWWSRGTCHPHDDCMTASWGIYASFAIL